MRFCCIFLIQAFISSVQLMRDSNINSSSPISHDQSNDSLERMFDNIENDERKNVKKSLLDSPRVDNANRASENQNLQTANLQTKYKKRNNSTMNKRHDDVNINNDDDDNKTIDDKKKDNNKTKRKRRRNHRCVHAKCHCKELRRRSVMADCDGKFKILPRFHELPFVLEKLSIRRGNLTVLPAASFGGVRMRELDLSGNNFRHSKIDKSAFDGLERSLTILSLNDCQMEDMPTVAILKNLKILRLEGNQFFRLEQGSFSNSNRLKELHLSENKITSISSLAFEGLNNLDLLDLSRNKLKFLEEATFSHLHKLTHLDLSGNLLEIVQREMFVGLTNLRWLKLDSNVIKIVEKNSFEELQKLKNLKLENNQIQYIEDEAFDKCHKLSYLSIDLANLTRITNDTFKGLNKLKTLNFGEFPACLKPSVETNENPGEIILSKSSINMTLNTSNETFPQNVTFYSGPRIFGSLSELERISLTDYGGHFGGLWTGMLSEKINFENLNVFIVPVRQCDCHQNWMKELTSLGTYVHGFCTDGRTVSCTKDDAQNMDGGINFMVKENKSTVRDGGGDVKIHGKKGFIAVNKAKT